MKENNVVLGVATVTGILLGIRTILSMFAAPFAGSMTDQLGNRWSVTIIGLIIGAIGMVFLIRGELIVILLGICFTALASGSIQALVTTRTGDLVNLSQRGKAIGLLHTVGDLGSAIGPVAAYALLRWITLNGLYLLSAFVFLIGTGLALVMYIKTSRKSF